MNERTERPDDTLLLQQLYYLLEHKHNWGPHEKWTNYNYAKLSELVTQKTGVPISRSTFMRIYGKVKTHKEFYNPNFSTRDALAQYLDYINWEDFKENQLKKPENITLKPQYYSGKAQRKKKHKSILKWTALAIAGIISTISIIVYFKNKTSTLSEEETAKIVFEPIIAEGQSMFTAIIKYDVSMFPNDSFFVYNKNIEDKRWLDPAKNEIAFLFVVPDYYKLKLLHYNREIKSVEAQSVATEWKAYYKTRINNKNEHISLDADKSKKGILAVSDSLIRIYNQNESDYFWFQYRLSNNFDFDLDDIEMEIVMRKNAPKHVNDQIQVLLLSNQSNINYLFSNPCCYYYSSLNVSEQTVYGYNGNLSPLGVDFKDFQRIKITVFNKNAILNINGEDKISTGYSKPLGKFKTCILSFKQTFGEVDYVKISQKSSGRVVYENGF